MTWISYLVPQQIARFSSPYNRDIRVMEESGRLKLLVNGSRQSGKYVDEIWLQALEGLGIYKLTRVSRILVLGVAGGTIISMLSKCFLTSKIVGVDIDPEMIGIGKKYFGLDEISNLTIIEGDAKFFVHQAKTKHWHYKLVVVDVYKGNEIPAFVIQHTFLQNLKSILGPHASIVFNYSPDDKEKVHVFERTLAHIYSSVLHKTIDRHDFFLAR